MTSKRSLESEIVTGVAALNTSLCWPNVSLSGIYVGTTARWVATALEKMEAEPIGLPSSDTSIPIIWFAVCVHTEPETTRQLGPSLGALKDAVSGSGPFC